MPVSSDEMRARERLALRLPESAAKARTNEAKAAFEERSLAQWEAIIQKLRPEVEKVRAKIPAQKTPAAPAGLLAPAAAVETLTASMLRQGPAPRRKQIPVDADQDKLPDALEEALSQAWVPRYFISGGEKNNFAFFADNPNAVVITGTQASPPIGYYGVMPLFRGKRDGVTYGFTQINYATFWDRDDGLAVDRNCLRRLGTILGLIGVTLGQAVDHLGGHPMDEEHSAALVAAPMAGSQYNPDPAAYRLYMFYTAAHENTKSDRSMYLRARQPIAPGHHLELYLSLSKHATYAFDPTGLPLVPEWMIVAAFWTIELLFILGVLTPRIYVGLLRLAEVAFFECAIEHWQKRDDGVFPSPVINTGSQKHPLNGSSWIRNSSFAKKLSARWDERVLRLLGFQRVVDPEPDPDPDPDPPDREPPDREPPDREPRLRER